MSVRSAPQRFTLAVLILVLAGVFVGQASAREPAVSPLEKDLFLPLEPESREAALDALREAREAVSAVTGSREPATPPAATAPELLDTVPPEERDDVLERLESLRQNLTAAQITLASLERETAVWEAFLRMTDDRQDLAAAREEARNIVGNFREERREAEERVAGLGRRLDEERAVLGLSEIARGFGWVDWAVIALYLVFTTILGALMAGKQATIRDFFLGGRKLPWFAVCGSIIATELSAATFLIAPAIVFKAAGDMTYLQLAIGTIIARFIIGYVFVPAYYEREIYSPYDYMGHRLGARVKKITTFLFMVGAVLAQGARVYIAALALQVITGTNIESSIIIIGIVSILWTWMGGIRTVIWTDVIQFLLFFTGAVVALVFVQNAIDGGAAQVLRESYEAGKLRVLNLNVNTKEAYTLWCGLFATGWLTLASHGTDQMMAQRMFTCRGPAEARKAIIWSSAAVVLTALLLFVGAGLFVYYRHHPLSAAGEAAVEAQSMRIFAIFIVDVLPVGVSGLLMAGIFATAISTLDSTLAALSQSTIATIYLPWKRRAAGLPDESTADDPTRDRQNPEADRQSPGADQQSPVSDRHLLVASRVLVIFWGILMTGFAIFCDVLQRQFEDLIQFALAMAAYTYGALLGTFLLAFLPFRRDDRGLVYGVPLSMLTVFALNWHTPVAKAAVVLVSLVIVIHGIRSLRAEPGKILLVTAVAAVVVIIGAVAIGRDGMGNPQYISIAWPWHYPIGTAVTLGVGWAVGRRK